MNMYAEWPRYDHDREALALLRVLITGGAGFIGSTLANRLVEEGHHVRVLDDLSAGDRERLDSRVMFMNGDIRDIPKLWSALQGVDCVYHLAARVSVPESVLYPVEYNNVNVGVPSAVHSGARCSGQPVDLYIIGAVWRAGCAAGDRGRRAPSGTPYAVSKSASEQYVSAIGKLGASRR